MAHEVDNKAEERGRETEKGVQMEMGNGREGKRGGGERAARHVAVYLAASDLYNVSEKSTSSLVVGKTSSRRHGPAPSKWREKGKVVLVKVDGIKQYLKFISWPHHVCTQPEASPLGGLGRNCPSHICHLAFLRLIFRSYNISMVRRVGQE